MKSKKTGIIVMAALLALLVVAFLLIDGRWNVEEPADTGSDTKSYTVSKIDSASIASISYTNKDKEYSFTLDGSVWKYTSDDKFPLDTKSVTELAEALSEITANKMIEGKATDSAEYGLDIPAHTVKVTTRDGSSHTYKIGGYNRHSGLYYLSYDKSDKVYMVSSSFASVFTLEESDYLVLEKMDSISASSVTLIEAQTPDGVITLTVTENTESGEKIYTHKNAEGGEQVLDSVGAEKIIKALSAVSLTKCADYYAEADELESFGLGEGERVKVSVSYTTKVTSTNETTGAQSSATLNKTCVYYIGRAEAEVKSEDEASSDTAADTASREGESEKVTKTYLVLENSNMIFEVDVSGADSFFGLSAE